MAPKTLFYNINNLQDFYCSSNTPSGIVAGAQQGLQFKHVLIYGVQILTTYLLT